MLWRLAFLVGRPEAVEALFPQTDKGFFRPHRRIKAPQTPPPLKSQGFGPMIRKGVCGFSSEIASLSVPTHFSSYLKVFLKNKFPSVWSEVGRGTSTGSRFSPPQGNGETGSHGRDAHGGGKGYHDYVSQGFLPP